MKGKKIRKYTELFQPIFIDDKGWLNSGLLIGGYDKETVVSQVFL